MIKDTLSAEIWAGIVSKNILMSFLFLVLKMAFSPQTRVVVF